MLPHRFVALAAMCLILAGCVLIPTTTSAPISATAEVKNAQGQTVGTATFHQVIDGLRIVLEVRGLPPGPKGVHLHAVGRCEAPDFTTAGDHYNPESTQHGLMNPAGPHAGDLPNITIAADGTGRLESMNTHLTITGTGHTVLDADGSALVIHADPDDFKTDPSGNTSARIACGVVTRPRPRGE